MDGATREVRWSGTPVANSAAATAANALGPQVNRQAAAQPLLEIDVSSSPVETQCSTWTFAMTPMTTRNTTLIVPLLSCLLGCATFRSTSYRTHEPGFISGDAVRTTPGPAPTDISPQLIYVWFPEETSTQRNVTIKTKNLTDARDDESRSLGSRLLSSLSLAGAFVGTEARLAAFTGGSNLQARKTEVLRTLERLFQGYYVAFTLERPDRSTLLGDVPYSMVIVSPDSRALFNAASNVRYSSYSVLDPGNRSKNDLSFVFDSGPLTPEGLAIEIAHSVGHMLGLEDVSENGHIMSRFEKGPSWSVGQLHDPALEELRDRKRAGAPEADRELQKLAPLAKLQNDAASLRLSAGRRHVLPNGTILGNPWVGMPYSEPTQGADPSRRDNNGCRPWAFMSNSEGGWDLVYICSSNDGTDISITTYNVPVTARGDGAFADPYDGPYRVRENHGTGGGGRENGNNPEYLPESVTLLTPAEIRAAERARGACRLKEIRRLARTSFADATFFWKDATTAPPPGATNCTHFLMAAVQHLTGVQFTPAMSRAFATHPYDVANRSTNELIASSDPSIKGPQEALVSAGIGTAVPSLDQVMPGDIIQYYHKLSNGDWSGHQGVVATAIPATGGYQLSLVGANPNKPKVGDEMVVSLPSNTPDALRVFLVRLNERPSAPYCNQ